MTWRRAQLFPFHRRDHTHARTQGDGNIRYFELVDEEPFVYFLAEHRTNVSTKVCDAHKGERPRLSKMLLRAVVAAAAVAAAVARPPRHATRTR